jgi:hypothetical protein
VGLYSICAGYAQQLLFEKRKYDYKNRIYRILKLLINYWIIAVVFSLLGIIVKPNGNIPGTFPSFIENIFLLSTSYNGAWWYLHTYIFLLLLPKEIIFAPVKKVRAKTGIILCIIVLVIWYLIGKFLFTNLELSNIVLQYFYVEISNLIGIMPFVYIGILLCKERVVDKIYQWIQGRIRQENQNAIIYLSWICLFIGFNVLQKSVLVGIETLWIFLTFNFWRKAKIVKKIFSFLGKHSTNIWLVHMFFYCADPFKGLVQKVNYPIFMFVFILFLSVGSSYCIMGIQRFLFNFLNKRNEALLK